MSLERAFLTLGVTLVLWLLRRVKESCSDYAEVRRALDKTEKQRQGLESDGMCGNCFRWQICSVWSCLVEKGKSKVQELQNKLDSVTRDFGKTIADLKITEEV